MREHFRLLNIGFVLLVHPLVVPLVQEIVAAAAT